MEISITPELSSTDRLLYIVRVNDQNMCILVTENDAKIAVDSLAKSLEKELVKPNVHVYRRNEERSCILYEQKLGVIYNGKKVPVYKVDYVSVAAGIVNKYDRFSLAQKNYKNKVDKPPQKTSGEIIDSVHDVIKPKSFADAVKNINNEPLHAWKQAPLAPSSLSMIKDKK